ncbi:MAG: hypothetical protein H7Z43_02970, partial [Clostridia bacterium]|nr:hypothetical protein [Deltaproteobacteria bacterium]
MNAKRIADFVATRLLRRTASGRFIPAIDGVRFVAIFWVVLFHVRAYVIGKTSLG